MANIRDMLVRSNLAFQNALTPDFWLAMKGKGDAKEIEKLIDAEVKELKVLHDAIDLGESDLFSKHMNESLRIADTERKDEEQVHSTNAYLQIEQEKRINEILSKIGDLKKFVDSKKIENKLIVQDINELTSFVSKIGSLAQDQAKMDYNLAHDHQAFARFLHLRNIHSVANRLKVLEKRAKRDMNHEKKDADNVLHDISDAKKAKSIKEFEQSVSSLHSEIKKYVDDATNEFSKFVEGARMTALLINHSVEFLGELKKVLDEAGSKGYDKPKYDEFLRSLSNNLKGYHDLTEKMLSQDRAIAHELGKRAA